MGVDNRKIFEEIFDKKMLGTAYKDLADAIITGEKCGELELDVIRQTTDKLVNTMIVYYGQRISDTAVEDIRKFCPLEVKKYHPHLTIQEVSIGVGMAMRDKFGEPVYQKLSIKLLNELIIKYDTSDLRKHIVKIYNAQRDLLVAQHQFVSEEAKEAFILQCRYDQFEKCKNNGFQSVVISAMDYNYLLDKCAVPDYKDFVEEAKKVITKPQKNQTTISDVMDRMYSNNLMAEAKRLAVISLYKRLIGENLSLKQYMASSRIAV